MLVVEKLSNIPRYEQLKQILRDQIEQGRLKQGTQLPTMRDLMATYDVSYPTVTRALRDLSQEGLIQSERGRGTFVANRFRAVNKMGNLAVITLSSRATFEVHPLAAAMLADISHTAMGHEMNTIFTVADPAKGLPAILEHGKVDALVFILGLERPGVGELLDKVKLPYLLVGNTAVGRNDPCLLADNRQGAALAVDHLVELGHRRIGFHTDTFDHAAYRERLDGYRQALQRHGLPVEPQWVQVGDQGALTDGPPPCTAIFASHDNRAARLIHRLSAQGISVPRDVSVVGFDDSALGRELVPRLTTIRVPAAEMGARAADLLHRAVWGQPGRETLAGTHELFPVELVVRESTQAPSDL